MLGTLDSYIFDMINSTPKVVHGTLPRIASITTPDVTSTPMPQTIFDWTPEPADSEVSERPYIY